MEVLTAAGARSMSMNKYVKAYANKCCATPTWLGAAGDKAKLSNPCAINESPRSQSNHVWDLFATVPWPSLTARPGDWPTNFFRCRADGDRGGENGKAGR